MCHQENFLMRKYLRDADEWEDIDNSITKEHYEQMEIHRRIEKEKIYEVEILNMYHYMYKTKSVEDTGQTTC